MSQSRRRRLHVPLGECLGVLQIQRGSTGYPQGPPFLRLAEVWEVLGREASAEQKGVVVVLPLCGPSSPGGCLPRVLVLLRGRGGELPVSSRSCAGWGGRSPDFSPGRGARRKQLLGTGIAAQDLCWTLSCQCRGTDGPSLQPPHGTLAAACISGSDFLAHLLSDRKQACACALGTTEPPRSPLMGPRIIEERPRGGRSSRSRWRWGGGHLWPPTQLSCGCCHSQNFKKIDGKQGSSLVTTTLRHLWCRVLVPKHGPWGGGGLSHQGCIWAQEQPAPQLGTCTPLSESSSPSSLGRHSPGAGRTGLLRSLAGGRTSVLWAKRRKPEVLGPPSCLPWVSPSLSFTCLTEWW